MTEIEFVGYSAVHPSDFIYDVPNGFTGYLLLLFDSPSELLIDGRLMRTAANSAILYTPGSRIYYRAAGEEYRNDWIRFRSDHSFVKLFPLTNTPFPVTDPEYCHQLFKLLTWVQNIVSYLRYMPAKSYSVYAIRLLLLPVADNLYVRPRKRVGQN